MQYLITIKSIMNRATSSKIVPSVPIMISLSALHFSSGAIAATMVASSSVMLSKEGNNVMLDDRSKVLAILF